MQNILDSIFNVKNEQNVNVSNDHADGGACKVISPSSSCLEWNDVMLPVSHFVDVPLINQLHSWDCGLACVLMVLNTVGMQNCSIQVLAEICHTTSIWTIDLACLLHKYCVRFSYFTVTIGANPTYLSQSFYKEELPADLERVNMLFEIAINQGIHIEHRSIDQKEISVLILSGRHIAIALIDQSKLSQSFLQKYFLTSFQEAKAGYTGHYIVICGYDSCSDEFEIRDPSSSRANRRISSKCLEEARKSFGTDEDLILISLGWDGAKSYSFDEPFT